MLCSLSNSNSWMNLPVKSDIMSHETWHPRSMSKAFPLNILLSGFAEGRNILVVGLLTLNNMIKKFFNWCTQQLIS